MREILPDVFTWSRLSEPHGYDFNGFLIRYTDGNLCLDPVEPDANDLDAITHHGVSRILLTNRNHLRAANLIRERTGAPITIHPADAGHARSQGGILDEELAAGRTIGPLQVIGVPGKSPGEVAFHWPERRLLIVGDCVIGNPPGRLGLLREKVMDDPAELRKNVKKLLALDFDKVLVGDGVAVLEDAKARLQELVKTFP